MTTRLLRIAIAEDEPDTLEYLQGWLARLGHTVVAAARTGRELVAQCGRQQPDLVLTDIKMPDLDGIEAARQIYRDHPVPVILISGYHEDEYIERAREGPVLAYLVKPITEASLEPAIAVALTRFQEMQALTLEAADLRQALDDRKVIERAKGILMKHSGMDEAEAFRRLRSLSMEKNRKLVEIAQMVLTAEEALRPPTPSPAPGAADARPRK
jgi:response regulator NasT